VAGGLGPPVARVPTQNLRLGIRLYMTIETAAADRHFGYSDAAFGAGLE
jgi:hypothetical protein